MGLSNEERLKGIYYAVAKITEFADELDKKKPGYPEKLVGLIQHLWHDLLGRNANSIHWVVGSSATNQITWGTISPWSIAVQGHCDGLFNEESPVLKARKNSDDDEPFDAFKSFLGIPGLLGQAGEHYKFVYNVFAWSEHLVYYLRRYRDELLEDLSSLSETISKIQGECFNLFKGDDTYARAYVLFQACRLIYTDSYPYMDYDAFTQYLTKEGCHHDLNRLMTEGSLKEISEVHIILERARKQNKLTQVLRAECFMKLAGHKYHYDHQFKALIKIAGKSWSNDQKKRLTELFEECKKKHEEYEKDSQERYENNKEDKLSLYGCCFE